MSKKRFLPIFIVALLIVAMSLVGLVACKPEPEPQPQPPSTFTATFETNGGSAVAPMEGITEIASSPVTTREGFDFAGWYLDAQFGTEATFPYTLTADVTFYAAWTEQDKRPVEPDDPVKPGLSEAFDMIGDKIAAAYALEENKAFRIDLRLEAAMNNADETPAGAYALEVKGNVDYRDDAGSLFYVRLTDTSAEEEIFGVYYKGGEVYVKLSNGGGGALLI